MDRRRLVADVPLAVFVAAVQLAGTAIAARHQHSGHGLDLGSTALLIAGPAALVVRRSAPWLAVAVALAAAITYFSFDYPGGPVFLSVVVALVTLNRDRIVEQRTARRQEELRQRNEERLQIARELHDVLAHSTAVVSVQAGIALHLMDTHPEQVRPALEAIRDASAESMRELRTVLELLRADGEDVERGPQPGLRQLDALLARSASAGVVVITSTEGLSCVLRPDVDLAAYRIVQESLTNAARHAGPGKVVLSLRYGTDDLVLEIRSEGGMASIVEAGRGIVGMRERAMALGGSLEAGPSGVSGFSVIARLPYGVAA
jgi:signal transduction histidine kinase